MTVNEIENISEARIEKETREVAGGISRIARL
jgi:hypothetical protein